MTGAEVLIKKGKELILGKVRHDGYDVVDFFHSKKIFNTSFKKLWPKYLKWRRKGYNQDGLDAEIETNFDSGFLFVPKGIEAIHENFLDLGLYATREIDKIDDEDGYLCGYSDYEVFVDYDLKEVYINGEVAVKNGKVKKLDEDEEEKESNNMQFSCQKYKTKCLEKINKAIAEAKAELEKNTGEK